MKRLGALVVAVGMVLGAVVLRDRIEGDDGGGGSGGGGSAELELRCSSGLAKVCRDLAKDHDVEVTTEAPGITANGLIAAGPGAEADFDVWLTDVAWTGIVADTRRFDGARGDVLGAPSDVLARSPVMLGARPTRPAKLAEACADALTWTCIGQAAGQGVSVGLPSPNRNDGLAVLTSAVAGYLGRTDYAANDFEDPGFGPWFDGLTAESHGLNLGDQSPLQRGVAAAGQFSVVGALEADVAALPTSRAAYQPIYPDPVVTADLVLVPAPGVSAEDALERLGGSERVGQIFATAGWRVPGHESLDGVDESLELPPQSGKPAAGVLQALRQRWES